MTAGKSTSLTDIIHRYRDPIDDMIQHLPLRLSVLVLSGLLLTACRPAATPLDTYSVDSDGAVVSIDHADFYRAPKRLQGWSLREGDIPAPLLILADDSLRLCVSDSQCSAPLMLHRTHRDTTQCRMTDPFRNRQGQDFAIGLCVSSATVPTIDNPSRPDTGSGARRERIPAGKPWFVVENHSGGLTARSRFKVQPL